MRVYTDSRLNYIVTCGDLCVNVRRHGVYLACSTHAVCTFGGGTVEIMHTLADVVIPYASQRLLTTKQNYRIRGDNPICSLLRTRLQNCSSGGWAIIYGEIELVIFRHLCNLLY